MKKELHRFKVAILIIAFVLGASLGIGVALLAISLTKDTSPMTLGGIICLILCALSAISFGYFIHLRELALARLDQMEALFGKGCEILSRAEFETALSKQKKNLPSHVYALHMRLAKGAGEDDVRFARLSLADLLYDLCHEKALIGYNDEADFLLAPDMDLNLKESIEEIDRHLRRNPKIVPYGLYFGRAPLGKEIGEAVDQAVEASYEDTLIRSSKSIRDYGSKEAPALQSIDVMTEIKAKRLRFKAVKYNKGEKNLYYLVPELYDPSKGPISGKDFRNAMMLSGSARILEDVMIRLAVAHLELGTIPGPIAVEIGAESLRDPTFLPELAETLIEKHIKTKKLILFLPAASIADPEIKLTIRKLIGLRIGLGVYEFGEEKVADLAYVSPLYVTYKTEYLRKTASESVLGALIDVSRYLGASPLLKHGDLLEEQSDLEEQESIGLGVNPEEEKKEAEEKEEEEA